MGYAFFLNGGLLYSEAGLAGLNNWQVVPSVTENHFYNGTIYDRKLWIVGQRGSLGVYNGEKVELLNLHTKMDLLQVSFGSDGHGMIVGCLGTVLVTSDKGKTWKRSFINVQ